jgi:hypothetical protein
VSTVAADLRAAAEPHRVDWLIDNAHDPYAKFTCSAPVGTLCRCWCAEGCDEFCSDQAGHRWEDSGECRITTWLENGGTPGELYMGDVNEPLRSGPIETEWDGECYLWQYAADEVIAAVEAGQ